MSVERQYYISSHMNFLIAELELAAIFEKVYAKEKADGSSPLILLCMNSDVNNRQICYRQMSKSIPTR